MREENHHHELSETKRYTLRAINRLAIGSILILWGSLLTLKQAGIIEKNVSTLPFVIVASGALIVGGGIYRLHTQKTHIKIR